MELSKQERTIIWIALHKRLRLYEGELAMIEQTGRPFKNRKSLIRSEIKAMKEIMDKMGVSRR